MISNALMATLLTAISGYTGYAIPGEPPRITPMPHAALAERVCGRPCGVLGFTLPTGEILIDEALPLGDDPAATSILVHELTHFLQMHSVAHPAPMDCSMWREREHEAFDVQVRWLRDNTDSVRTFSVQMVRLNLGAMHASCPNDAAPFGHALEH
jgi:hypothetical protein